LRVPDCHPDRKHGARGLCVQCYKHQHYLENIDAYKGRARFNRKRKSGRNKLKPGAQRKYVLKRKYGITEAEFVALNDLRNGRCDVCKKIPPYPLRVDHDHNSGLVRGLLCQGCNVAIGLLGDDLEGVMRAVDYLKMANTNL
jgi:hypothetical protein